MNTIHIRYEGLSPKWTGDAVSGQIGTLKCLFEFDESWSEYNTVYMVVAKGNVPYDPVKLDETNSAEVQEIALQERCILSIGAVGLCEKDGKIFRYNGRPCRIAVDQGNLIPDPNKEPDESGSETAYEQVLLQLAGKLNASQGTENAGRVLVVGEDGIVRPGEYAGGGTILEESDPTVPAWAKQPQKPTYTAEEVGALSESELDSAIDSALAEAKESGEFDGEDGKSGVYVGGDPIPSGYNVQVDPSGESVELVEVDAGLTKSGYAADAKVVGDRFKEMAQEAPVQSVNGKTGAVKLSAADVGADASGTADTKVSAHNTSDAAHNDIRLLIAELTSRLNALADSDDTTLDQMSELVAYIKSNKSLIDSITTSKVSVADIVNNLTTNVANKPLSAAQGVALKALIDAIKIPTTLPASDVYSWAKQPQKPTYTPQEIGAQPAGNYAMESDIPTVPVQSVNGKTGAVKLSASDVGAASTAELTAEKTAREQAVADLNARLGQQNLLIAEGETVEEALAWLETNGDKTKAYLLPDDFFYTYRKTTEAGGTLYRNLLPEATDTDRVTIYGDDYTGDGVKDGYITGQRLSSSGTLTAQAGMSVSGFIPAKEGDILRIKGLTGMTSKAAYVISYNSANEKVNYKAFAQDGANIITPNTGFMSVAEDGTITFPLVSTYFGTGFNAIRFAGVFDHTAIVTINEEIVAGTGTVIVEKWASTGHALVSSDYGNEIAAVKSIVDIHTAEINALKEGISEDTAEDALSLIKNWDAPIYDANIPVFELSAEKAAMTDATKTPDALYGMYDALMAKYPHYITKTDLGICSDGVNHVYRYDFKDPEQRHTNNRNSETKAKAILVSGIHYEWAGMFGLYYALEEIAENPVLRDLRRNVHLIVIPCCNPFVTIRDNIEASGGQQNANGVEVHRNFEVEFKYPGDAGYLEPGELHHGGTEPLSEVETQYIDEVLSENTDAAFFVTCHNYNLDEIYGVSFLWPSVATAYMCNMGYRLIDKMSQVWMDRYGEELAPGIASYRTDLLESWDTRLGYAQISGSPGTETKQATKYGIQAANVEICERFHVHGTKNNPEPICSSFTMSRGAEAYVNFLLMAFGCYDPKDKKEYYLG